MKYVTALVIFISGVILGNLLMGSVSAEFDHSVCQYPIRWSNPKDGCDNSDPAVPQCIKSAYSQEAESECINKFVEATEQPKEQAQKKPTEVQKINVQSAPKNTCN